jgi:hypothetical protein
VGTLPSAVDSTTLRWARSTTPPVGNVPGPRGNVGTVGTVPTLPAGTLPSAVDSTTLRWTRYPPPRWARSTTPPVGTFPGPRGNVPRTTVGKVITPPLGTVPTHLACTVPTTRLAQPPDGNVTHPSAGYGSQPAPPPTAWSSALSEHDPHPHGRHVPTPCGNGLHPRLVNSPPPRWVKIPPAVGCRTQPRCVMSLTTRLVMSAQPGGCSSNTPLGSHAPAVVAVPAPILVQSVPSGGCSLQHLVVVVFTPALGSSPHPPWWMQSQTRGGCSSHPSLQ